MNLNELFISELQHEAGTTKTMLERVPPASLGWKPHEKSRALGEIAEHIAKLPGMFIATLNLDEFDRYDYKSTANTVAEIVDLFDQNVASALDVLKTLSDERMLAPWRYKYGEQVIL